MSDEEVKTFEGQKISVEWDGRLCIHIGECGRARGDLFIGNRQPWCQPDLVPTAEVVDVVKRCPTGALTYRTKDEGSRETADLENVVMTIKAASGRIAWEGESVSLCRCGESKNKPFCDGSHKCKRRRKNVPVKRPDGLVVAVRKCTALKSSRESEVLKDFRLEEADGGCLRWRCTNAFGAPVTSRG